MQNLIKNSFKVVAFSMILFFLLDLSLTTVDALVLNSRISNEIPHIKEAITENNCLLDSSADLYISQLNSYMRKSKLNATFETNFKQSLTVDGVNYPPVNEANYKEYGGIQDFVIVVHYDLSGYMTKNVGQKLVKYATRVSTPYVVKGVPCLRFLK